MAHSIQAINAYRPRIELGKTVQKPALLRAVSRATSLVEGTLELAITETRDQIIEICRSGRAVKVEGLGRFEPVMDLDGNLSISFRPDPTFAYSLNEKAFEGIILNPGNIGKTSEQLIALWNEDHPGDPVIIPTPQGV
jgi:hypothetical protein